MKIEIDIKDEYIRQAIGAGLNGGIRYWCARVEPSATYTLERMTTENVTFLLIVERDESGPEEGRHFLDFAGIKRALAWLVTNNYTRTFAAICSGDADSWHGDVLIQVAIFGEVKYA